MQHADPVTSQAVVDLGTADLTNAMLLVRQPLLLYECTLTSCLCYQGAVADIKCALTRLVITAGNRANRQRWLGILCSDAILPMSLFDMTTIII